MHGQVVGISGIDVSPDVGTHEEPLLEEDTLVARLGIWSRTLGMEMMEMQVLNLAGVRPAAERLYKDMRQTRI